MSTEKGWGMRAFDWFEERLPIVSFIDESVGSKYPAPKNLNYFWNFGALAGFILVVMIITGILLAMSYTPHVDYAFESVERIMRDVNSGWLHPGGHGSRCSTAVKQILNGIFTTIGSCIIGDGSIIKLN